jgi:LuxR family quorum sensing-dependent transcriptional regulator
MRLDEALADIEASGTIDDLRTSLNRIVQDYGFSGFTFIDAGRPELDVPYYTGTHPAAWERSYLQNGFVHVDPALARVRRTNTPFTWSDLTLPKRVGRIRAPQQRMMDAAREFGFTEGLVVPLHYRDRLGAIHSSSTVFFWQDKSAWFRKLLACHRNELHLVMIYWIQRAMHIVDRDQLKPRTIFDAGEMASSIQLTAREREVMAWAARGKTTADTAEILGLSPETVTDFIKQALRKLGALNKTHAVAKSIALGLIDL